MTITIYAWQDSENRLLMSHVEPIKIGDEFACLSGECEPSGQLRQFIEECLRKVDNRMATIRLKAEYD